MNVTIKINTGNAAFDDGNLSTEVSRILRELADTEEVCDLGRIKLYDINGNACGSFATTGRR